MGCHVVGHDICIQQEAKLKLLVCLQKGKSELLLNAFAYESVGQIETVLLNFIFQV